MRTVLVAICLAVVSSGCQGRVFELDEDDGGPPAATYAGSGVGSSTPEARSIQTCTRAGQSVCPCLDVSEAPEYEHDATHLATAILGKWMWCTGIGLAGTVGIEFAAGNTWYALDDDTAGNLVRDTAPLYHGTFHFAPADPSQGPPEARSLTNPEPLDLWLDVAAANGGSVVTPIVYFPDPRVLFFGVGIGSDGGPSMNDYAICQPVP